MHYNITSFNSPRHRLLGTSSFLILMSCMCNRGINTIDNNTMADWYASCGSIVPGLGIGGCRFIWNLVEADTPARTPPCGITTATACIRWYRDRSTLLSSAYLSKNHWKAAWDIYLQFPVRINLYSSVKAVWRSDKNRSMRLKFIMAALLDHFFWQQKLCQIMDLWAASVELM